MQPLASDQCFRLVDIFGSKEDLPLQVTDVYSA